MIDLIRTMFSYDFMVQAIVVGLLVTLCASLLGVSMVLKRYSMIGDGLSHVGFASLALALGLADEIQASAGGIKLDTMFVDEGFGSLDEEILSKAMKALTSLADGNRLVGIISHVGELKQKIDKQIIVKKDKAGGSKAEIVI